MDVMAGSRIAIIFEGTRGDSQPYIVAGKALQSAGYKVMLAGAADAQAIATQFGLDFVAFLPSAKDLFTAPEHVEAFTDNDLTKMAEAGTKHKREHRKQGLCKLLDMLRDFKPDLLLCGPLMIYEMLCFGRVLRIPVLGLFLSAVVRSNHVGVFGVLPKLPSFANLNLKAWDFVVKMIVKQTQEEESSRLEEVLGVPKADFWPSIAEYYEYVSCDPKFPLIFAVSTVWQGSLPEDFSENCIPIGPLMLESSEQSGSEFGAQDLQRMEAFLAAGQAPIYMGYGSITCHSSRFMTLLSLRALKLTGQRGVFGGGWAGMSLKDVEGEEDAEELRAYSEENVLFMDTVPHAILFPRCKVIVHHGGAGTLNASVRAGVPTVVAPIILDQFIHAELVNKRGFGVGLKRMKELTPQKLAAAINECMTSQSIRATASELGSRVSEECGPKRLVEEIQRYMAESVSTGLHLKLSDELHEHHSKHESTTCCTTAFSMLKRLLMPSQSLAAYVWSKPDCLAEGELVVSNEARSTLLGRVAPCDMPAKKES